MATSDLIVHADEMGAGLIFDGTDWNVDALTTAYSNATSGLTATDIQSAIDELDAAVDALGSGVELRLVQGEYDAATDSLVFTVDDGAGGNQSTVTVPVAALAADLVQVTDNGDGTGAITVAGGAPVPFVTGPVVSADAGNLVTPGTDGGAFLDAAAINAAVPSTTFEICDSAGNTRHTLTVQAAT